MLPDFFPSYVNVEELVVVVVLAKLLFNRLDVDQFWILFDLITIEPFRLITRANLQLFLPNATLLRAQSMSLDGKRLDDSDGGIFNVVLYLHGLGDVGGRLVLDL